MYIATVTLEYHSMTNSYITLIMRQVLKHVIIIIIRSYMVCGYLQYIPFYTKIKFV